MSYNYTLIGLFCLIFTQIVGQNEEDALRYSNTDIQGTARYAGMGGAFGALGADITVLSTNPAGMGRYKNNVLTGTINVEDATTLSTLNGADNTSNFSKNVLNNLGIIGVSKTSVSNPGPWRKVQFGFAYNRLAEFNDTYTVKGENNASYSYVLADRGYGRTPDGLVNYDGHYSSLAYESFLIDYVNDSNQHYYTTQMYSYNGEGILTEHSVSSKGRVGESAFSLSGNYADKVYLGATIGVDKIIFDRTKTHYESANSDSLAIDNFTFTENLSTRGNGVNLKLGIIVLPEPWLRLGLALHTSTNYYYMRDTWNSELRTSFKDGDRFGIESLSSSYVYKMKTPGKAIGSVAFIAKKYGVVSLDVEYVNYGNALLKNHQNSGDSYDFNFENTTSDLLYQPALNIRAGVEYKITNQFMARVGYGLNGQPFKKEYREEATPRSKYSLGLGFRSDQFFIDLAVIHNQQKENYYLYDSQLISNSVQTKQWTNGLLTIGLKI